MSILEQTLKSLRIGEAQHYRNLTVFPLLSPNPKNAFYMTLEQALAQNSLHITEVDEGGSVPELLLKNRGEQPVLLLDGEELIGAKQNRMLNLTILAPANSTLVIPVSCIEQGRWHAHSHRFDSAGRVMYAELRARKLGQVSEALHRRSSRSADQSSVWQNIQCKLGEKGVESYSDCASDLYGHHQHSLHSYITAFYTTAGQTGVAFAIDGKVAGIDLFDSESTLQSALSKLVKSYALECFDKPAQQQNTHAHDIQHMLDELASAEVAQFTAIGMGHDLRFNSRHYRGAALEADDRIVHLCAFRKHTTAPRDSENEPDDQRFAAFSQRRNRFFH